MASQVNKINIKKLSAGEVTIEEMKAEMFPKLRNMSFLKQTNKPVLLHFK